MGLTSTEVQGKVQANDILIGKNYLTQEELQQLKLIVEQYLAFAEAQAQSHRVMYMADWEQYLDLILRMNGRELLTNAGSISIEMAESTARATLKEYKEHERVMQKNESIKELERDLLNFKP